jgi:N-acetylglucosaminyldiphosphoundecaprenol N-acetyl-beta-D-mannosaminyltransferase
MRRVPCVLSTPNVNIVVGCRKDAGYREMVADCDLSVADGAPLVWVARLLGIPIRERVAGSDLFQHLRSAAEPRLAVYFYGGADGVAEAACRKLNAELRGLAGAGFESPGFGTLEEMSSEESISRINTSGADFVLVSLGARNGQAWIVRNRARVTVPVISYLGAVMNFVAGTVQRAPLLLQRAGLEWLWRIWQEPALWRRYLSDGWMFLGLLFTRALPLAWLMRSAGKHATSGGQVEVQAPEGESVVTIRLGGAWVAQNLQPLRQCFSQAVLHAKDVGLEMAEVSFVDNAFIGLLLVLRRDLRRRGRRLVLAHTGKRVRRILRYACADYLLADSA